MQSLWALLYILFGPFYLLRFTIETLYYIYIFCDCSATIVITVVRTGLWCLCQLLIGFLWIFFNCTFPLFVHCVNAFGWICLNILTLRVPFVDVPAILVGSSIIAIVYYEKVEVTYRLGEECWQLTKVAVRSGFSFIEMVIEQGPIVYRRAVDAIRTWKSVCWESATQS